LNWARWPLAGVLALAVVVSGTAVVYAKYASRKSFVELQQLRAERDAIDVEWGRLQLEESTLATHVRVERIARDKLKMHAPDVTEIVVLRPKR